MMADGYTMDFDGKLWYMSYDSAMPILMDEDDYWIQDGLISVKPGFSGPCLGLRWQDGCLDSSDDEMFLTCENLTPEVATMDIHGNVNAISEGYAEFRLLLQRRENNGDVTLMGSAMTQIFVSNEDRTPDYRDLSNHTHNMVFSHSVEATCEGWGMDVYKCSGCPYTEENLGDPPLNHDYRLSQTIDPTCTEYGWNHYTCARCANTYSAAEIDPLGHDWNGTECDRCGDTRLTPFDDVEEDSFYETPVAWAVAEGITNGASANTFNSGGECLRAQVVTFLYRAAKSPAPGDDRNPFGDVQSADYFYAPVLWAVENGITNGVSGEWFGAYDACNRAAVVTFLWRTAGEPEPAGQNNPFVDVNEGNFFYKAVLWAVENGITNGVDATHFGPTSNCNRAQVVTFLYRAFGK